MSNTGPDFNGKTGSQAASAFTPFIIPDAGEWAVAWTKSRAEKALTEYLDAHKVKYFLPLIIKRRVYGRQVRESKLPLFPGYVFYDCREINNSKILESGNVARTLHTTDQGRLRSELNNIAIAVSKNPIMKETAFETGGIPVKVVRGPFRGLEGEFARRKGKSVLVIKVTMLSRAMELEIEEANVARN